MDKPTRTVTVEVTFRIDVQVPDDPEYDAEWDLEENHCAGTGRVGAAFDEHYRKHEAGCWSCGLKGTKVKIVE